MIAEGTVCIVTGASSGIGLAMAKALAARDAVVICADIDGGEAAARATGGIAARCDVTSDEDLAHVVERAEAEGPLTHFVSNAGVMVAGGIEAPDADWERAWQVNALSHVRAARHAMPHIEHYGGQFAVTASAAGLLTQIGALPYAVSKHAAVAIAEGLAIAHPRAHVSVLCPQAVRTAMTANGAGTAGIDGIMEPGEVAETWIAGMEAGRHRILPHPQVATYARRRAEDPDRWVRGMQRLAEASA